MANGYNPYQGGVLQSSVQQYGDRKIQRLKHIQSLLGTSTLQGKHIKKVKQEIQDAINAMNKKRKKRGILGGLLGLGSLFVPGLKWWGQALLGGALSGGMTADTKKMIKKQQDKIDKMSTGTLADKLIEANSEALQGEIDKLDPVKAAVESFAMSSIMHGIGKGVGKIKEARATKEAAEAAKGVDAATTAAGELDVVAPGVVDPNITADFKDISIPGQEVSVAGTLPGEAPVGFEGDYGQYEVSLPSQGDFKQAKMPEPSTFNTKSFGDKPFGQKVPSMLQAYLTGAGSAYGMTPLSDPNLLKLLSQYLGEDRGQNYDF